ncbi:hypothetical protein KUTeg_019043 [Tegillarca granosa]|uniref:Tyrosinase copper-binding domain-containing protein n=1 Tax=Tegillarca granosa TaxID=220873 RepID=A0ABQ9EBE2_TEGGR|nr:hypothetical protein KUTeg_019043 [Tegillarca granosa]
MEKITLNKLRNNYIIISSEYVIRIVDVTTHQDYVTLVRPIIPKAMNMYKSILSVQAFVWLTCVVIVYGWIEEIPIKASLDDCFNERRTFLNTSDSIKDNFHGFCIQKYRLKLVKKFWSDLNNETGHWIEELLRMSEREARQKRDARHLRIRKEIRVATDRERSDYFTCMRLLKEDTSIEPNRFDALGIIHQRMADDVHHGAAFLPWHRILLTIIENACRQKVPSAVLLYWDSRLDDQMQRPSQSVFFSRHLIGECNGKVTDGPYANWVTPSGDLVRNCALEGELFNHRDIRALKTRTRLEQISEPFSVPPYDFEIKHGEVHLFVGGTLAPVEIAAFAPEFYLHHAFVDCMWEEFRENQKENNVDPQTDYPVDYGDESHNPTSLMGFGRLRNIHGLSDMFTSRIYRCEKPVTKCSVDADCRSRFLYCNRDYLCASKTKFAYEKDMETHMEPPRMRPHQRIHRGKRQAMNNTEPLSKFDLLHKIKQNGREEAPISELNAIDQVCPSIDVGKTVQNLFDINGVADSRMWVFIPVKVIYQRNMHQKPFNSFLVRNGKVREGADIYDKKLYKTLGQSLKNVPRHNKQNCKNMDGVFTKVNVHSDGLNYIGTYRDFAVVDARQPITTSVIYMGVKSPSKRATEVLLTAYDPCGNVCQAFCRTAKGTMEKCSGSLKVTQKLLHRPNLYGEDYGKAVDMMWGIPHDGGYPRFYDRKIFIEFVCF